MPPLSHRSLEGFKHFQYISKYPCLALVVTNDAYLQRLIRGIRKTHHTVTGAIKINKVHPSWQLLCIIRVARVTVSRNNIELSRGA